MSRLLVLFFVAIGPLAWGDHRPNVLVIVADDLGYADLGFQGAKDIQTPNLDSLAATSVRCTSGYVSHPFCSPTRAGLLTGRYQHRFGHENNPPHAPEDAKAGLPVDQITIAQVMKEAGYKTGLVGKWHLGAHPSFHPNRRGFDEFFGFIGGGHLYDPLDAKGGAEYKVPLEFNGEDRPFDRYLTDILGREASAFVDRHAAKPEPWMLFLTFNAPHTPLSAPKELIEKYKNIADENRRMYAAMIDSMDSAIGGVVETLAKTGERENTLVFFMSDNGGAHLAFRGMSNFANNKPLRGAKGDVLEGGIRVPFLVSWPRLLKPGVYDRPVIALDVFATVAAAGGSVNLMPYLRGYSAGDPHSSLFWRSGGPGGKYAVRQGDWKLVRETGKEDALYALDQDVGETKSLAASEPAKLSELKSLLADWEKETIPPVFAGPKPGQSKKKAKK